MGHLLLLACTAFVFFAGKTAPSAHGVSMNFEQNPPKDTNGSSTTRMTVDRFNEAFNRHDPDALGSLLTDDTVFEDTSPRRTASASRASPLWSRSGAGGSREIPMRDSKPKK